MPLFDIPPPKAEVKKATGSKRKVKKGQTVNDLIMTARKLVEEKLGKYKETSKCVLDKETLQKYFDDTEENSLMAIDTETTG